MRQPTSPAAFPDLSDASGATHGDPPRVRRTKPRAAADAAEQVVVRPTIVLNTQERMLPPASTLARHGGTGPLPRLTAAKLTLLLEEPLTLPLGTLHLSAALHAGACDSDTPTLRLPRTAAGVHAPTPDPESTLIARPRAASHEQQQSRPGQQRAAAKPPAPLRREAQPWKDDARAPHPKPRVSSNRGALRPPPSTAEPPRHSVAARLDHPFQPRAAAQARRAARVRCSSQTWRELTPTERQARARAHGSGAAVWAWAAALAAFSMLLAYVFTSSVLSAAADTARVEVQRWTGRSQARHSTALSVDAPALAEREHPACGAR